MGYYFSIHYFDINLQVERFFKSEDFNNLEDLLKKAKSEMWELTGYDKNIFMSLDIVKIESRNNFIILFDFDDQQLEIFLKK